jgi:hypothetical protein
MRDRINYDLEGADGPSAREKQKIQDWADSMDKSIYDCCFSFMLIITRTNKNMTICRFFS